MKKITVTANGKEYPCRPTMGAMLRFKRETGKEVTELKGDSLSDLCVYLFCCVQSACAADGVEFGMELLDFADALSPEDLAAWSAQVQESASGDEDGGGDGEKKRKSRKG